MITGLQERTNLPFDSKNIYEIRTIKNSSSRSQSVSNSNKSTFSTPPTVQSNIDQSSWTKIPSRHSPNFILSDGSNDSPTQKYLDSHSSSSPSRSPKIIGNSHSNSPIANDEGINNNYSKSYNTNFNSNYKNNNTNNNNTFSPASSSRFSSAKGDAPKIQNLTPTYKGREISSLSPSQNTNILNSLDYSTNINHIPKIEEDELASDSSNKGLFYSYKDKPISSNDLNLHFNYDQNESDVFNVKLNESETNLTKKFSKERHFIIILNCKDGRKAKW